MTIVHNKWTQVFSLAISNSAFQKGEKDMIFYNPWRANKYIIPSYPYFKEKTTEFYILFFHSKPLLSGVLIILNTGIIVLDVSWQGKMVQRHLSYSCLRPF